MVMKEEVDEGLTGRKLNEIAMSIVHKECCDNIVISCKTRETFVNPVRSLRLVSVLDRSHKAGSSITPHSIGNVVGITEIGI